MITSDFRWDREKFIWRTVTVSIILHLLLGASFFIAQPWLVRAFPRLPHVIPTPQPSDEVVTISDAPKHDIRNRVTVRNGRPPQPKPHPKVMAQIPRAVEPQPVPKPVVVPKPVFTPVPTVKKHEIAKTVPDATPEPPKTAPSLAPSEEPTAEPAEKQVAYERPQRVQRPSQKRLSAADISQIESDLSKSIAEQRVENNPLNTHHYESQTTSVQRQSFQMQGQDRAMTGYQGLCDPIKSWTSDGWDYYYVSCHVVGTDGMADEEAVPWPIRFRGRDDPWIYGETARARVPIAGPLPGWVPPSGIVVGKGIRAYAKTFGYDL